MAQNYICTDNGTRLYPVSTASTTTTVSLDIGQTHVDGFCEAHTSCSSNYAYIHAQSLLCHKNNALFM